MSKSRFLLGSALALQIIIAPAMAAEKKTVAAPVEPKGPSLHVQCDGYPNNMTAGESAARLLGAVTLLALFAPPPESADPKSRKFGAEGVDACSQILAGEKTEGNQRRRIELMQARALHKIEAKDYEGALGDVAMARQDSAAAGLPGDPFYSRSAVLGMDQIKSAALIRQKKPADAVNAAYRQFDGAKYQYWVLSQMNYYGAFVKADNPAAPLLDRYNSHMQRVQPDGATGRAARLADLGRFAEAAKLVEAALDVHIAFKPDNMSSYYHAVSSVNHALAGDWQKAETRAAEARQNDTARVAAGKPDELRSEIAELLDLYEILKLHRDGNLNAARRMFTGRSAWLAPSLGALMETNRRLAPGASADDKIGLLALTPDQMWEERETSVMAQLLAKDADNKTLFYMPNSGMTGGGWETYSKKVWNTEKKSKILRDPNEKNGIMVAGLYDLYGQFLAQTDALLLHSALVAKSKGHTAFYFNPVFKEGYSLAQVRFGKAGDPGLPAELVLNPDDVIAQLEAVIPRPETIKARKAAATKKK